ISDRVAVLDQHRECLRGPARQLLRELAVAARHRGLADVRYALVVERPADLLVVVRDLQVVEDGRLAHRSASAWIAFIAKAGSFHGSGPGSSPAAATARRAR